MPRFLRKNLLRLGAVLACLLVANIVSYSYFCGFELPEEQTRSGRSQQSGVSLATIAIMSAPLNTGRRDAIRRTWASGNSARAANITTLFIVGCASLVESQRKQLQSETETHSDLILLDDVTDTYENLTTKLLRTLSIVERYHPADYFVKADDDTFVVINRLVAELASKPRQRFYWGYFSNNAHVKSAGPWAERKYFLCERYLPYARGGGYVITRDLVQYIIRNEALLTRFRSEDVSLGTWLGPLDIVREHDVRFDSEATSRGCRNDFLLTHKQTPDDMDMKWNRLSQSRPLCAREARFRAAYRYNWSVPPSQCCLVEA